MKTAGLFAAAAAMALCVWAGDARCPEYPQSQRDALRTRLDLQRSAATFAAKRNPAQAALRGAVSSANFIDDQILGKMAAAGIEPAPLSGDTEFLRRAMLDLTGRIPSPEQVESFLADGAPNKRAALIDSLLASEPFVDHWTQYFGNRFQVTSAYYQLIGIPGRNLFYRYLRQFVEQDRSWRDLAAEIITAAGDSHDVAPPNFVMRNIQQGDPIQDTWDTLTNTVTTEFLGVQTQCVSCHDGRRHLEEINLYLVARRRDEFMRLSAFFSRMSLVNVPVDAFNQQRKGVIWDLPTGTYHGLVDPLNPGARPPRRGSYEPQYMFTGEEPSSGEWRRELARMVTADRQFARAAVNYIWTYFFRTGIVDPPNAWDLERLNPANPPPLGWNLQPSHPELLEQLADTFIADGSRFRSLIRLIANSNAYQLSSRYEGNWRPDYALYFARQTPRRLSAEELYDAVATATGTLTPIPVEGFEQPLLYAGQFPDPTEPRDQGRRLLFQFLEQMGRGDWWQSPRSSEGSVVQALYLMNDLFLVQRTQGASGSFQGGTRVARLLGSDLSDDDAVRQLFLATLGRPPMAEELEVARRNRNANREIWLGNVQWSLLNRVEFLFNQ